ncbi:fimbria/pilus outer membrane usher protein [Tahibacter sp. UC22_41]|uniref:fimbria/pilus outer membrane usher protein n=1 Tax=Tahibacter sp. UC22_41 TaxID=3350178 RepID=UPI0036DCC257
MRAWISWVILELGLCATAAAAPEAGERVVYEVLLQQRPTGRVDEFRRDDGVLYAPRRLLEELGLELPAPLQGDWIALDAVPGLAAEVDDAHQALSLSIAPALRPLTLLSLRDESPPAPQRLAPGISLGYAANRLHGDGQADTFARIAPRVFGPYGVFGADLLYASPDRRRWQRIETWWQQDFPAQATQLRIGDAIAPGPAWSRAVRYGGVHWGSDYSLRPDLITYPLPDFRGEAAVPSALDLVVNGLRTQHGEVPEGPFAIPRLPVISGGGEALVVITDALGREQVSRVPFYVSTDLLRDGLTEYSLDAGKLRRGYADRYGDAFASWSRRRGYGNALTGELQLQAAESLRRAGLGLIVRAGQIGAMRVAAARSDGDGCDGSQFYLASEWQRGRFALHTAQQWKRGRHCDLAALAGSALPRRQSQFTLGLDTVLGQFSLSRIARTADDGANLRLSSLSWSRRLLARAWLSLSLQRLEETGQPRDNAVQVGLLLPLGDGSTALAFDGVSGARDRRILSLQKPPPAGPGWGYRVETALERSDTRADVSLRTSVADLSLELQQAAGGNAWRAGIEGALVYLDGHGYASRRLGDAFAVLDTGAAPGVSLYRENQFMGRSDAGGRLLVPELRPYEANQVALEPRELPPDVEAEHDRLQLRPYRGGGIVAGFGVRESAERDVELQLADGSAAPLGSRLYVDDAPRGTVGYGGLAHAASTGNRWELRGAFGRCRLAPLTPRRWRCEAVR